MGRSGCVAYGCGSLSSGIRHEGEGSEQGQIREGNFLLEQFWFRHFAGEGARATHT